MAQISLMFLLTWLSRSVSKYFKTVERLEYLETRGRVSVYKVRRTSNVRQLVEALERAKKGPLSLVDFYHFVDRAADHTKCYVSIVAGLNGTYVALVSWKDGTARVTQQDLRLRPEDFLFSGDGRFRLLAPSGV